MYTRFQSSYYNRESQPFLTPNEFKLKTPISVVDLSYQNESVKIGPILLIQDRLVEYNPLNGLVQRVV